MLTRLSGSLIAIAASAVFVLGCAEKGDCEKAADHIMQITMRNLPEPVKAEMSKNLDAQRKTLIEDCKKEGLSKKQEECVLKATTLVEVEKCDDQ